MLQLKIGIKELNKTFVIMDYKQKYGDALDRAKMFHSHMVSDGIRCAIEEIFPELAESEDERIRKTLIEMFSNVGKKEWKDIPTEKIIAWLEKQGEQKSAWDEEDSAMAFTLMRDVEQMSYISTEGKNERIKWLNSLDEKL